MSAQTTRHLPTRIAPTHGEDALRAFLNAEYDDALRHLEAGGYGPRSAENDILRARIMLALGEAAAAIEPARSARCAAPSTDAAVLSAALEGLALDRVGNSRHAAVCFAWARRSSEGVSGAVRGELAYLEALTAWSSRDLSRARQIAMHALPHAPDIVSAQLLQLVAWIETREERYTEAARQFEAAWQALQRCQFRDARLEARIVHGLAVVASETLDLALCERVDEFAESVRWSAALSRERFNTTTCRRFAALARGDFDTAYRLGERALHEAPSFHFEAIAHANHGALLQFVGDRFGARHHFAAARRLIEEQSWREADVEQRIALPNYAIEAARHDPAGASRALTIYRSVVAEQARALALQDDRRIDAFADLAEGRVAEGLGQSERAVAAYQRSLGAWRSLGYRLRAAIVASDLVRLTGDPAPAEAVYDALALAPNAWFRDGLPSNRAMGPRLTSAQRRVLDELLAGKASKEIAATLGRSDYTIRNQTKAIFRAFEVRSRAALIVRCRRDGIGPPLRTEACA